MDEQLNECLQRMNHMAAMWIERAAAEQREERQALADLARADDAPEELRKLQLQIDRGEFTLLEALTGDADDLIDKRLRDFLDGGFAKLSELGWQWQAER